MSKTCKTEIYPRYCFHLSPTVNTWCLLHASEIHALQQHAGFEVVAIDDFPGRRVLTIDDSSGRCIEALVETQALTTKFSASDDGNRSARAKSIVESTDTFHVGPATDQNKDVDVGDVVDVKGSLSLYREEKQIKVEKMVILNSTAQEIALWQKRTKFRCDTLQKPWVLRPRDIRRCRKESEASEANLQRKRDRLRDAPQVGLATKAKPAKLLATSVASFPARSKLNAASEPVDVGRQLRDLIRSGSTSGKYGALGL
ncbi:uncharacterized protein UV8b_00693 [Ustilaginoidea virens]|uniref:CST complex subunit Stn1 N-terminal domain-containing protein n=1 Tax=Ustilaginoidea virens TaxID=1159556 RepID=A0A8E5HJJ9_USTVR|nr:uncharacterized protein UV8b_00693 [Ustilaginoidea virens]QUC16452.1 hypothetical protein UV8b_00693 [Ustilaginoidea virens]